MLNYTESLTLDTLAGITGQDLEATRQALIESPASAHLLLASSLHGEIRLVPWAALDLALLGELEEYLADEVITREEAVHVYRDLSPRLYGIWHALCETPRPDMWLIYATVRDAAFALTFAQDVAADVAAMEV